MDETLETKRAASSSTQINHATPQSPIRGSVECIPWDHVKDLAFAYNIYTVRSGFSQCSFCLTCNVTSIFQFS